MGWVTMECCDLPTRRFLDLGRRTHRKSCLMNLTWDEYKEKYGSPNIVGWGYRGYLPGDQLRHILADRCADDIMAALHYDLPRDIDNDSTRPWLYEGMS